MNDYVPSGLSQLEYYCGRICAEGNSRGFAASSADVRGSGSTHEFLRTVRAELAVGGNSTRITYNIVYCPIADRTYLDSRLEDNIKMNDFPRFDEFVSKSKELDALVDQLLPEKQIVFS